MRSRNCCEHCENDEQEATRLVCALRSESADFQDNLQWASDIIAIASSELRVNDDAQINLLRTLIGVRYRHPAHGVLVTVRWPYSVFGRARRAEDSSKHMPGRYDLTPQFEKGSDAISFLAMMARSTKPGLFGNPQLTFGERWRPFSPKPRIRRKKKRM